MTLAARTESQRIGIKDIQSDVVGLEREVSLYDCNGNAIHRGEGRFTIEIPGAYLSFMDDDGNKAKVRGTVSVQAM
jgi:hypothetical protein